MNILQHQIYLIYSEEPVDKIRQFLLSYSDNDTDIGIMRIDHSHYPDRYRETNRTIVTMNPQVYQELIDKGYDNRNHQYDFRICKYEIRVSNHPPFDCGYALYMKMP